MSYFFVIEGIDGAGTTSQAKKLVENLNKVGKKAIFTFEPSNGEIGKFIRSLFTREEPMPNWETMALLFSADRMQHLDAVVKPALEKDIIVVSDRYYYSTLGYQTYSESGYEMFLRTLKNSKLEGVDNDIFKYGIPAWVLKLNEYAISPDTTFIIDIDVEVAQDRLKNRGNADQFESKNDLQFYLANYYKNLNSLVLPNKEPIIHIDGHQSKEDVERSVWKHMSNYINLSEGAVI